VAGGIDWYRAHHGTVADPKLGLVAAKAKARRGDVIAVWHMLLEAASAATDRGRAGAIDFEATDFLLGMDDGDAKRIHDAMIDRGLLTADPSANALAKTRPLPTGSVLSARVTQTPTVTQTKPT
jgi:hypothetical protein